MKYVSVRVVDSNGNARSSCRVSVYVYQFAASGMTPAEYTDSSGLASFSLDIDQGAEISIYVDGYEKIGRAGVRTEYVVVA